MGESMTVNKFMPTASIEFKKEGDGPYVAFGEEVEIRIKGRIKGVTENYVDWSKKAGGKYISITVDVNNVLIVEQVSSGLKRATKAS